MSRSMLRRSCAAIAFAALTATPLIADPFESLARPFEGEIGASGENRSPIAAGGTAMVSGRGFTPGQVVTLRQGGEVVAEGLEVDEEGEFAATIKVPEGAAPGIYPVVAEVAGPDYATVFDLKVSPVLEESGAFATQANKLVPGLYQVAVSESQGALYVTSAVGRPPVSESKLLKLDPETLEIVAEVTPEAAPAREDGREGGVFAVYGVGVADEAGQVWVTNTRQDTVAVYDAEDLSLIKQFEPGAVSHARDVAVHDGKAYVTATFEPLVHVFDTESLEELAPIELSSGQRRGEFGTASLQLDPETGRLFVVSLGSDEVAVVDLASGEQTAVYQLPLSQRSIGVSYDAESDRIFTAGMGSDNVLILDAASGEVLHEVMVGSEPLNVAFDPQSGLAYVALRGAGTVVALTPDGEIAGNMAVGSFANHLTPAPEGGVLVVNKSKGAEDSTGDHITRITPEG